MPSVACSVMMGWTRHQATILPVSPLSPSLSSKSSKAAVSGGYKMFLVSRDILRSSGNWRKAKVASHTHRASQQYRACLSSGHPLHNAGSCRPDTCGGPGPGMVVPDTRSEGARDARRIQSRGTDSPRSRIFYRTYFISFTFFRFKLILCDLS